MTPPLTPEALREKLVRMLHERFCMGRGPTFGSPIGSPDWDTVNRAHKNSDYPDADAILALLQPHADYARHHQCDLKFERAEERIADLRALVLRMGEALEVAKATIRTWHVEGVKERG